MNHVIEASDVLISVFFAVVHDQDVIEKEELKPVIVDLNQAILPSIPGTHRHGTAWLTFSGTKPAHNTKPQIVGISLFQHPSTRPGPLFTKLIGLTCSARYNVETHRGR